MDEDCGGGEDEAREKSGGASSEAIALVDFELAVPCMRGWPWRCGAWRGTPGLGNGVDEGCSDQVLADTDCEMGTHVQRVHSGSAAR